MRKTKHKIRQSKFKRIIPLSHFFYKSKALIRNYNTVDYRANKDKTVLSSKDTVFSGIDRNR